jgi:hypothetical protein
VPVPAAAPEPEPAVPVEADWAPAVDIDWAAAAESVADPAPEVFPSLEVVPEPEPDPGPEPAEVADSFAPPEVRVAPDVFAPIEVRVAPDVYTHREVSGEPELFAPDVVADPAEYVEPEAHADTEAEPETAGDGESDLDPDAIGQALATAELFAALQVTEPAVPAVAPDTQRLTPRYADLLSPHDGGAEDAVPEPPAPEDNWAAEGVLTSDPPATDIAESAEPQPTWPPQQPPPPQLPPERDPTDATVVPDEVPETKRRWFRSSQ